MNEHILTYLLHTIIQSMHLSQSGVMWSLGLVSVMKRAAAIHAATVWWSTRKGLYNIRITKLQSQRAMFLLVIIFVFYM